jgi:DNA-binding NarL/FixJ family response regulator
MAMVLEKTDTVADAIHIVIADDHPLVRGALRQAVVAGVPSAEVREAGDLASLSRELSHGEPVDLVLLDLAMPGVSGFSGLLYLRSQHPEIPVIVVSATEDHSVIRRCVEVGAAGFVPKSAELETMKEAIRVVLAGEIWTPDDIDVSDTPDVTVADMMRRLASLTPQQLRVLMMLSQGLLNKQIAYELKVSEATVKAHVSAILQKLGVDSRTQAVIAVSKIEQGQFAAERDKARTA